MHAVKEAWIMDSDPGIDDLLAIFWASKEQLPLGIATVSGNIDAETAARNIQLYFGDKFPIYVGAKVPFKRPFSDAKETHGLNGRGYDLRVSEQSKTIKDSALDFYRTKLDAALQAQTKVALLALGPITNIAKVVLERPSRLAAISRFFWMGGAFRIEGNTSELAEYNCWWDPDAANALFNLLDRKETNLKIQLVPLDVTKKIVLTPAFLDLWLENQKEAQFLRPLMEFYFDFHREYEGIDGAVINDALCYALFRGYLPAKWQACHVRVGVSDEARGVCFGDFLGAHHACPNAYVAMDLDPLAFWRAFIARLIGANKQITEQLLAQVPLNLAPKVRYVEI